MNLVVSQLSQGDEPVEIVERKGVGHPDSICDALAETLSRNLCRHYLAEFGEILHHNVDKALLCGGSAAPRFGGGDVLTPIDIFLAGRAVADATPLTDIVVEGSRAWLRDHLHALDAERDVRLHNAVRCGSQDLDELFRRRPAGGRSVALANDTSIGVGYAPFTALERLVLRTEQSLNGRPRLPLQVAWGEDVKVMGVRQGNAVSLTIACAMIGRHLADLDAYRAEVAAIRHKAEDLAAESGFAACGVQVNAADDPAAGSVYLTVTGTSAEAGDDGQVGRGNRVNGLITPFRPMSLEAAAGKNPVSHVGKIYNVVARHIAETMVMTVPEVAAARCYLVSRIGSPVTEPALAHLRLATHDGSPALGLKTKIGEIAERELQGIPAWIDRFVAGTVDIF
ncbi:MAG: methionine adenosyltransferase [Reyranella sp.]|nr:methionine adenosyltransferase [Reyranella sp.]